MSEELEFGTGWKPDKGLARFAPISRMASMARAGDAMGRDKPSSFTIAEPRILHQGRAKACSAFGVWLAGEMWDRTHGAHLRGVPSPWFAYQAACWLEAGGVESKMRDDGCSTSTIQRAYERFGVVPLSEWGPDQGVHHLNPIERPPFLVRSRAQKVDLDLVRIFDRGASLVERIVDSIALGEPCPLALGIGSDWQRPKKVLFDAPSSVSAYHLVYAYGYRGYPDKIEVRFANSWGTNWLDGGSAWLTAAAVGQAKAAWFVRGVKVGK